MQWTPSLHTVDKVELIMPISDLSQDLLKLLNCFKIQIDIHAGGIGDCCSVGCSPDATFGFPGASDGCQHSALAMG